ncbi:MAG: sigma 54-interacting transcriptional regulator [Chitinispirillaceae bacterium]|nr:sigma 54-interacting transcriptional regulator [Chitinispirillaceae bacterium]
MKRVLRYFGMKGSSLFELRDRLTLIGSSKECDIVLDDKAVPDAAIKIVHEGGTCTCEILSGATARLNGKKIHKSSLAPGDRIEINGHVFICDNTDTAASRQPDDTSGPDEETLREFSDRLGGERDLKKLLTMLMEMLLGILKGSDAFIFKLGPAGEPEVFVATGSDTAEDRFSDTVVQTVLKKKQGVAVPNALADPAFSASRSVADLKLSSVVCAPIMCRGEISGIIYVGSSSAAISYSARELSMLTFYATIAGMLINHVDYIGRQNRTIATLSGDAAAAGLIAESKAMQEALSGVRSVAASDIIVLLEGPTGCGKSHLAGIIHRRSRRASGPFLVVNCSTLHGERLESELFGHRRGSFTSAINDHDGLFVAANGGTLLLDEIGELDAAVQARLLRVLECGMVRPLGATQECAVDVRVICATNKNLSAMVQAGSFRSDLYYRINQFAIRVPPLSERNGDVELLAYFFLEKFKAQYPERDIVDFHPETLAYIRAHDWPGNIRELSNAIHRAVLSCEGPLLSFPRTTPVQDPALDFETTTRAFHRELITRAIKKTGGNKEAAARLLGMGRSTFFRYLSTFEQRKDPCGPLE